MNSNLSILKPQFQKNRKRKRLLFEEAALMASELSPEFNSLDFAFAFKDVNFSDRILRIEIIPDSDDYAREPLSNENCDEVAKDNEPSSSMECSGVQVRSHHQILAGMSPFFYKLFSNGMRESKQRHATLRIQASGDEVGKDNEPSSSMECSGVQVRSIHISSVILAAMSPFFYKLFSNGMRESKQRHATLRIQASEEDAVMDMLKFMYSNTLPRCTPTALLNVLVAADKFEVASCMRYCTQQLCALPMTCESALTYLDLLSTLSTIDPVQQLKDAAKKFLADRFKDLIKNKEEAFKMPLVGIEAILSTDDLKVYSEDRIFDFVLKWAELHYPDPKERKEVINNRLLRLIRFPYMTSAGLKRVLTCKWIKRELAKKIVLDALFFKDEASYRNRNKDLSPRRFVRRWYRYRPVTVVELEHRCIAYLDIKREECEKMFPSKRFYAKVKLGERNFVLSGQCNIMDSGKSFGCFGLFIGNQDEGGYSIDYELAARSKPSENYVTKWKSSYSFVGRKYVGSCDLFSATWTEFMADDSPYFINGVLHLKVEFSVKE